MIAAYVTRRIARRLARKLVKPIALWLVERQLRISEARADRLVDAPRMLVPVERRERKRQIVLIGRRNLIREW